MTRRVAPWVGVGGFRDSAVYFEGSSSEPQSADQHAKFAVVRCVSRPTTNNLIWSNDNGIRGWQLLWRIGRPGFRFHQADGGGSLVTADAIMTPHPGDTLVVGGAYNSPNAYVRVGAVAGSGAGAGGVTLGIRNATVGVLASGLTGAARDFASSALLSANVGFDAAGLAAACAAIADNFVEGRDLDQGLGFALGRYWDARDWAPGSDWIDRVAGQALTPTGAPQVFGVPGRAA